MRRGIRELVEAPITVRERTLALDGCFRQG